MSWWCAFPRVLTSPRRIDVHSSSARANFHSLHKDLLAQRGLLYVATPTSPTAVDQDSFALVHSVRSQQISRMNRRMAEKIEPASLLQLLELLQLEACFLLLSALGCLVSPLATIHTRQQHGTRLSTHFLSFHRGLAYLCIVSPCLSFLPFLLFHSCLSLCRMSIGADMSGPCAARSRHAFSVPMSPLSLKQACHQGHDPHCTSSTFSFVLFLEHSPNYESKSAEEPGALEKELCFHTS